VRVDEDEVYLDGEKKKKKEKARWKGRRTIRLGSKTKRSRFVEVIDGKAVEAIGGRSRGKLISKGRKKRGGGGESHRGSEQQVMMGGGGKDRGLVSDGRDRVPKNRWDQKGEPIKPGADI